MPKKMIAVICAVALSAVAFAGCAPAANTSAASTSQETSVSSAESSDEPLTGAYGAQRELTDADKKLFAEVMKDQAKDKTYEPVSVATQVVAGTNYMFLVNVTQGEAITKAHVVIFEPLPSDAKTPSFVSETPVTE